MSVVIHDKVGRMCRNAEPDVKAIQDALNRVPPDQGGTPPNKKLTVNGLCDGRTIEAIQLFQLKQFGWPGADGKIFPEGQTHTRINQILGQQTPVDPIPQSEPAAGAFLIRMSTGGTQSKFISKNYDLYLLIEDAPNNITATFKIPLFFGLNPKMNSFDPYGLPEAMSLSVPIPVGAFDKAEFNYVTVAVPAKDLSGFATAACSNTMMIRLHGAPGWRYFFNRRTTILEADEQAWKAGEQGKTGVFQERIGGRMQRMK